MTKAVRVHQVGGPEALVYEAVDVPAPGHGEVRIKQHAVGLNFIDVYYRTGLYKAPSLPFVAGNEAAFHFRLTITAGDHKMRIEPIDVMVFDGRGKVSAMKAYWSAADVTNL